MPSLASTDTSGLRIPPPARVRVPPARVLACAAVGSVGSILLTLSGPRLVGGPVSWWFHPRIAPGGTADTISLYLGMALLSVAWLGLWNVARSGRMGPRGLVPIGLLWSVPLAVGAPLFSHDVYSYLAQGTIGQLGLNPYHTAPLALGSLGHVRVLGAVDPFWRHATAPYGPLFLVLMTAVSSIVGAHLVAGVLLIRAIDLLGLALLWIYVPRLSRALGADPTRALWLAALSPLVLLQLVAPGHNDLLMIGLMVAGVTYATEGRPLLGIAICAAAMTIKLPAGLAALFIAAAWLRALPGWRARLRGAAQALLVVGSAVAAVSLATGWGLDWISATLFSTPARVRLAITPATNVAWTLHDLGIGAHFLHVESVTRVIAAVLAGAVVITMLFRVRIGNLVGPLGLALVALAVGGPAAWPWYFTWGLVLLAATRAGQRSRAIPVALIAGSFLVKANGILLLPLRSAPIVLAVYSLIALAGWYAWVRRRGAPGVHSPTRSALARSSPG